MEPGPTEIVDVRLQLKSATNQGLTVTLLDGKNDPRSETANPRDWSHAKEQSRGWRAHEAVKMEDLSQVLGECLMPGRIADELGGIKNRITPLRMRLWIESDEAALLMIPWEAAQAFHDPNGGGQLAGCPDLSVVRRIHKDPMQRRGPLLADKLRVRIAAGARMLEGDSNKLKPIDELVKTLKRIAPQIDFDLENDVDTTTISHLLAQAHVFCFNGHAVRRDDGRSLLIKGPTGERSPIGVNRVNSLLKNAPDLRVVILDACASGEVSAKDEGWSRIDADVLIAWQREMGEQSAAAFARGFYEGLAKTGDLDEAVREGREKLGPSANDSIAPVVYCRYTEGTISLAPTPPAAEDEAGSGSQRQRRTGRNDENPGAAARRPLVRWQPADPTPAKLRSWLTNSFREAAKLEYSTPRFITPYIGPGVLQTDARSEEVRWDAGLAAEMDADPDLAAFVEPLLTDPLSGRLNGRTLKSHEPNGPVEQAVSAVRIAMARLAEQATATFVKAELEAGVPLNLWERHSIPIAEGDPLMEHLDVARSALARHQALDADDGLLGISRLQTRLGQLRAHLLAPVGERINGVGGEHDGLPGFDLADDPPRGGLSGASVAWLTDLFWHTVVFDSPLYPHVSELSLQVSLLAGQPYLPTRSLDPATVVARAELGEMSAATARSVARGYDPDEPADRPRRHLHRAIAEVLHADYDRWSAMPLGQGGKVVPFALTTGFDLEMERGLAAWGKPYEVAIPIYTRLEDLAAPDDSRPSESVFWIVGEFAPHPNPELPDLVAPVGPWRLAASLQMDPRHPDRPAGPLLIKLNGSPSHLLPTDPSVLGITAAKKTASPRSAAGHPDGFGTIREQVLSIQHAVSLGEYDFLQVTRMSQYSFHRVEAEANDPSGNEPRDGLPESIVQQVIRAERFWMLLGHRFADWNSRAQIHTFIAHESRDVDRGCAVAKSFDTDRLLFLDWLGITRASGEMRDLIEPFERAARDLRTEA